jgi:NADPH-dependent 2,4-dienoyl-CoA reductase/sulfur reductase-like enzyme/nitrite reductase/ring-hydroxylating ferredoxin subunit
MSESKELKGPDLAAGVPVSDVPEGGALVGRVGDEAVMVVKRGLIYHAVGATCSHYGGPLAEGLIVGDTVRCPWHHACFDLKSGEALRAPGLNTLPCFKVVVDGTKLRIAGKLRPDVPTRDDRAGLPRKVVIVGAGAAGSAAAEMLRRCGYMHSILLIGADPDVPVDRPNLSKDYLAGTAPEEWVTLRGREFYQQHGIDLLTGVTVSALDTQAHTFTTSDGRTQGYDKLLLATGADPIRLPLPGADLPHVRTLRTFADSRAIIAAVTGGVKRAVVMGASFIGLEVAASLRTRGLEVHVVAPEARPLEKVLGPDLGDFIRALHEDKGVVFHLGTTATAIDAAAVTLKDGTKLPAELVVLGVGVRPSTKLAESAGLAVQNGIVVDENLQTSAPDVYAAGDAAAYPAPRTGEHIRVEHWAHAQRMGQVAARNIVGRKERFDFVPFFWSQHYDVSINYVGYGVGFDATALHGKPSERSCTVAYRKTGKTVAVATIWRDQDSLAAELALERDDQNALRAFGESR